MALDVQRATGTGIDVSERGRDAAGQAQTLDRRLFMQLLVFSGCRDAQAVIDGLVAARLPGSLALYADLHDPAGLGLLASHEDPAFFVTTWRRFLLEAPIADLVPRSRLTMFGRTYSIGYEPDLERALITRPQEKITDPDLCWAIWYPLRRTGAFEQLNADEQRTILMEHGGIGMAFGRAGLGTDIRLASHGLDRNDNDFTVALLGAELAPLSKIVERMRKTRQTAQYLQSLGPFFVGKVIWQQRHE